MPPGRFMKLIFTIIISLLPLVALADVYSIPWECYPKQIQQEFEENDLKLDLDRNDRTLNSWGFLENRGAEYIIYTYRSLTRAERKSFLNIINKEENYWRDQWQNQQ